MTSCPPPPSMAEIYETIVDRRRSVRAFLPRPIAPELMDRLFTVAGKAPSNCNVQPWITHVVSGASLSRVRSILLEEAKAGRVDPDVPLTSHYIDQYKTRRIESAVTLFRATGVERDDKEARTRSFLRNYELFDAPHAAFFFMPRYFGLREAADLGIYAQTLMLALSAHGLGSCPQGAISHYSGALKRELGVSDDLICLFGLSFGYPDDSHVSANAITDRASLAEVVVMHQ
ncbi:nitroreductase [Sphingobium sp.]|uniref:nitroreductase n=1 Tax=Sphingobium sp. TaxID=1912891 RepID=UPI0028BE32C3|nr:nitroreductase [Sphingobium sp.]